LKVLMRMTIFVYKYKSLHSDSECYCVKICPNTHLKETSESCNLHILETTTPIRITLS
jgi:hypothetical protein